MTKGDIVDGILWQMQLARARGDAPQIDDYPETVSDALRWFYRIWGLPDGAIPTKRAKSKYQEWVSQMQEIVALFGKWTAQEVMELSFHYFMNMPNKFIIARPLAIKKLVIAAVSELNRREAAKLAEATRVAEEKKKEESYDSVAAATMAIDLLKKMRNKDDE